MNHCLEITRLLEAGYFLSFSVGRIGLDTKLPPQFGHTWSSRVSTHDRQKVHSKLQIIA